MGIDIQKTKQDNLFNKQASRFNYIDFYKGICTLFIIITHYKWTDDQRLTLLFPFWIQMAVPIFMVITGYVSALSLQRRQKGIFESYRPRPLIRKWSRFIVPFFPVFVFELLYNTIIRHDRLSVLSSVEMFFGGGVGPGSYYFPIMLQVVIILPIIYACIRKLKLIGLLACFAINLIYEILKNIIHMTPDMYRVSSLRYLFIIAYGCYLYIVKGEEGKPIKKIGYYSAGIVGFIYIIIFVYLGRTPAITNQWTTTSLFSVLFIVPITYELINGNISGIKCPVIELLGKASFDIFLMQMVYYEYFASKVYSLFSTSIFQILINIIICCGFGLLYYNIEMPLSKRLIQRLSD